jgi:hypothetical protein
MTVGLPREADAAMCLDVLLRREVEGVSCSDAGGGAGDRQLRGAGRDGPGAVVGVRSCQLDRNVNVGELVFDGLERGDRPPKSVAIHRIGLRHVEACLRAADLLERREDRGAVDQLADNGVTTRAFEALSWRAVENDFGLGARRVDPFEACTGDAFAAQFDHINADVICLVARRDDREMRDLPVWYRHLGSGQTARRHFGLDVLRARIAHPLGESDRTDAASVDHRR